MEIWLDGVNVTPAVSFKASPFTWQLDLGLDLARESAHTYEVRVRESEQPSFVFSARFHTDVRGAGDFWVEAEDFNYAQGRFRPAASAAGYEGGAYEGLGAVHGIDYGQANPTNTINDNYRQGEERNVTILYSDQLERSGYDLASSWIVVGGQTDWYNYTRTFPVGSYRVYAAVSGAPGGGNLEGTLSRVTNPQSANQTLSALGSFQGPPGEGWGENRLLPLIDPQTKLPRLVSFSGVDTVRYTVGQGALDYLVFVPYFPISLIPLSRNRVQINWTGSARLEEASDPAGPWEEKTTGQPPVELVLPEGASRGFYRLSRKP